MYSSYLQNASHSNCEDFLIHIMYLKCSEVIILCVIALGCLAFTGSMGRLL